ncbi:MAG: hypothetical protein ACYDDE_01855 [bacterium]
MQNLAPAELPYRGMNNPAHSRLNDKSSQNHSCAGRKVLKVETHAVSVHEAISRERSGHPENQCPLQD